MSRALPLSLYLAASLGLVLTTQLAQAELSVRIYSAPIGHHGGHAHAISPHGLATRYYRPPHHAYQPHHPDRAYLRHPYGYRYAQPNPYYRPYGHYHPAPRYRPYAYRYGREYRERHHRHRHHRRHHHDRHGGYEHPPMGLGRSHR